jgi:YD repeat-containing protein
VLLDGSPMASYTYDDAWRLTGISSAAGSIGLGYDPGWRRSSMGLPNGVATTYGYDDALRLAEITALLGATPVSSIAYTYDSGFNWVSKAVDGVQETYSYDAVDRLRTATVAGGSRTDWTYDAVGNRLTQQGEGMLTRYTYDAGNRLTSAQGGGTYLLQGTTDEASQVEVDGQAARQLSGNVFEALVPVTPGVNQAEVQATDPSGNVRTSVYEFEVGGTTASYTYDGAGFLTGRSEGGHNWGYEWNARGELARVTKDGSEVARYEYDPLGRRIRKVAQGTTYSYVYDGMDILREMRTDGTTYTYIHGLAMDEPLARLDQGGQATYYLADDLGSIVKVTNAAGQAVQSYRYDAWGNIQQGGEVGSYAFTGREWDPETGLYYYRARYYDPKIGRFVFGRSSSARKRDSRRAVGLHSRCR